MPQTGRRIVTAGAPPGGGSVSRGARHLHIASPAEITCRPVAIRQNVRSSASSEVMGSTLQQTGQDIADLHDGGMKVPLGVWTPRAAPSALPRPARNSCALSRNRRESLTAMSRWPSAWRAMHLALDQDRPAADLVTATEGTRAWTSPELSVVVATLNERDNVAALVGALERVLAGTHWEVIFVDDDSPDGTAAVVRAIARANPRVRCLRRIGRKGLAGACIEGMLASSARAVAVMDGDLQHDEALLPRMLEAVRMGADLVIATRFGEGGSAGTGLSPVRAWGSRVANRVAAMPARRAAQRSHERLLHDPARCLRSAGARAFHAGLQAAARYRRLAEAAACDRRAALPLPGAPAWRLQARRHRGDGPSRPAAGQAFGRPAAGAVRAVCGRGSHGPARASRRAQGAARDDADRLRRGTGARGLCGHDLELRAQQPAHLSRSPAQGLERASGDCSHSMSCAASARSPTSGWRAGCTAAARAGGWPAPRAR